MKRDRLTSRLRRLTTKAIACSKLQKRRERSIIEAVQILAVTPMKKLTG